MLAGLVRFLVLVSLPFLVQLAVFLSPSSLAVPLYMFPLALTFHLLVSLLRHSVACRIQGSCCIRSPFTVSRLNTCRTRSILPAPLNTLQHEMVVTNLIRADAVALSCNRATLSNIF